MDKFRLFRRTRGLEFKIDEYLSKLSESAILFKLAVKAYLREGCSEDFEAKLKEIVALESSADGLRRRIKTELYTHTLIPESRGDVLGLIETLDDLLNYFEGALLAFHAERPEIPDAFRSGFKQLTNMVVSAVDALVLASRAFFHTPLAVTDYNHKVLLFEKEADKVSGKLKREIFESDLELSHKMQLRDFVEHIDKVANWAEDVADRLEVYAIKRTA
jgi:predicted phosphate transport protein (TIGR00153 family)